MLPEAPRNVKDFDVCGKSKPAAGPTSAESPAFLDGTNRP
jgi:hypothetical protein